MHEFIMGKTLQHFLRVTVSHSSIMDDQFDVISVLAGVHLVHLPPYSPDLNPIEEAFSKIKAWIRRNNDIFTPYADEDSLIYDMEEAMNVITELDAIGYFIHAGYF